MKTVTIRVPEFASESYASGDPHGWIQWQGTKVCMDIRCPCGYFGHIDAEFASYVRCGQCGQVYEVDQHVLLRPLGQEETPRVDPVDTGAALSFAEVRLR